MADNNEEWREGARLHGELYVDAEGEAHFICHTQDDDFAATREAIIKFIGLLTEQLMNARSCPLNNSPWGRVEDKDSLADRAVALGQEAAGKGLYTIAGILHFVGAAIKGGDEAGLAGYMTEWWQRTSVNQKRRRK